MTVNSVLVSLMEVKILLQETLLLKTENYSRKLTVGNNKFSQEFLSVMFSNDYEKIYKTAMKNLDYDYLLTDDSFFQFSAQNGNVGISDGKLRYAYFPNPRKYETYLEFLDDYGFNYEECGNELIEEYEQYVSEAKLKTIVTPIRYDYDFSEFSPIIHPISHIHIGAEQHFRLPLSSMITPQEFTIFVIKNLYNEHWIKVLESKKYLDIFEKSKNKSNLLGEEFFNIIDKKHLYLS